MASKCVSLLVATELALATSGCGLVRRIRGESFPRKEASAVSGATDGEVVVETTAGQGDAVTGKLSASSTSSQRLNAGSSGRLAGSSVLFPPGSVTLDTAVTVEEGLDLSTDGALTELGIAGAASASPALVVSSDPPIDAAKPFTVGISTSAAASLLEDGFAYFIVYKVKSVAENKTFVGVIPSAQVTLANGVAQFAVQYFGSYQLFKALTSPEAKNVETQSPIVTKNESLAESGSDGQDGQTSAVTTGPVKLDNASLTDGATGVEIRGPFTFRFNQPIDTTTVGTSILLYDETSTLVGCDFAFPSPNEVTVTPQGRLIHEKTYRLEIKQGLKGTSGSELDGESFYNFTIRPFGLTSDVALVANAGHTLTPTTFTMAGNAAGQMVIVWNQDLDKSYAQYFDGNVWGTPHPLDDSTGSKYKAVVTQSGKACVAWDHYEVRTVCYSGGTWQPYTEHNLTANGVYYFGMVETDPDHVVMLWWEDAAVNKNLYLADWDGTNWNYRGNPTGGYASPQVHATRGMAGSRSGGFLHVFKDTSGPIFYGYAGSGTATTAFQALANYTGTDPGQVIMDDQGDGIAVGDALSGGGIKTWRFSGGAWQAEDSITASVSGGPYCLAQGGSKGLLLFSDPTPGYRSVNVALRSPASNFPTSGVIMSSGNPPSSPVRAVGNAAGDFLTAFHYTESGLDRPYASSYDGNLNSFSSSAYLAGVGCLTNESTDPIFLTIDDKGNGAFACTSYNSTRARKDVVVSRFIKGQGVVPEVVWKKDDGIDHQVLGMHTAADGRTWIAYFEIGGGAYPIKLITFD